MQASILFITRSILIIIIASKMILFVVGASVNHFSRRLGGIVRLRSSTEIFAKSNMEFSDVGGSRNNYFSGINSAFVTCFRGTKLSSFRVRHYSQVLPISASARAAVPTEYAHSVLTNELNDSQKEATLRPRYSITRVIAGPGAGKTKVLTCRIAHLLLDNDDYNREGILAVTFTKKAAMEMESRLTDLLSSLVSESSNDDQMADDPALEQGEFVQYGNADPSGENNLDNAYARSLLRQATVGTFHSVCSKILRKFGKELGELPSVRQCIGVMNLSGAQLAQEGIQTLISGEQSTVVTLTLDGSFNILDQSDQLRLLKDVLKEHNIELSSPVASSQRNGDDIRPITVLNAISLMNTEEAISITQGGRKEGDTESSKMSKKVRQIATQIRTPFQKAKYTQNSVDFDDLILLSRELLLQHEHIREVLHSRWRHILVDEFQDTSQVQLDLVRLLTTNSLFVVGDGDQSIYSWRGASPESMTLDFELAFHNRKHGWEGLLKHDVGLTKYLERICGGDSSVADSTTLEVKSVYLMENYRSTTNIVRAAQRIISSSESINRNSAQDSIRRDMKPMRGEGPSPRVLACKDGKSEANFVVNTINSMVESDDLTPSSTVAIIYRTNAQSRLLEEACVEHNLRYVVRGSSGTFYKRAEIQDCMSFMKIMYNARDRSAWARAVKAPSRGIGEASLQEFFSYCDAIAAKYLDAQINGSPPTPLDVLVSLIPRGDGDKGELDILIPPSSCMSTRSLNRFISFASSVKSLKEKSHVLSVSQFLMSVIDDLNLRSHFDSMSKTREEYDDRLANVMELVRAANRYDDKGPSLLTGEQELESPLGNFLDDVALIADIAPDESEDGNGRIVANLMTIHSSKGMEFDAVFLVGNEEGIFPTQKAISEGEGSVELSEERRLCYVAMTRAKTHLVLTWRREVSYFAGTAFKTKDTERSRFLRLLVSKPSSEKKPGVSKKADQTQSRMSKREANKYIATSPTTRVGIQPPSKDFSSSKRGLHSQTSQKHLIKEIPTIRPFIPKTGNHLQGNAKSSRRNFTGPQTTDELKSNNGQLGTILSRHKEPSIPQPRTRIEQNNKIHPSITRALKKSKNGIGGELPPDIDSTLFFPVGSTVKHKFHGRGIVQDPPQTDYAEFAEKMLVRVKFLDGGGEWDVPMESVAHTFDA